MIREPGGSRATTGSSSQNFMNKGNPVNLDFRTFILPPVPQSKDDVIASEKNLAKHIQAMKGNEVNGSSDLQTSGVLESDFV